MKRKSFKKVPYSAQAQITVEKTARLLAREDANRLYAETPYGPIGEESVSYICPLALLWTMASASDGFGMFLFA